MKPTHIIENIVRTANHCNDAEELRNLAKLLNRYGAWAEAEEAERRAREIERRLAEEAAK